MFEENTDILILRTHSFSFLIFAPPFEMVQVKELNAVSSQIHRTRHLELNFFLFHFMVSYTEIKMQNVPDMY